MATHKRPDVFISSTSKDLPRHRQQAMEAILRMGLHPIMMEHLPAVDADAIDVSLAMVDEAEIYLGIFGQRYGYIPAGHDISITEMEYRRAVERDIPRLVFVMHEEHPIKAGEVETGEGALRLGAFKERVLRERVVNFFKSPEDLRAQVIQSLVPYREADTTALHSRHARDIPLPPEPYIAHPYSLLQTGDLIGRQKELSMLSEWARQADAPVYNFVVAIGGMGKSALTWKWFNDLAPEILPGLAGRMWWSFYESDARFENFISRALAYVSRRPVAEIEQLPAAEQEMQLLGILDQEPHLVVFDGLERIMIAYARMDAARMADDDLDERTANYAPGDMPESVRDSFASKHHLRKTADPRIGAFLRKMTQLKRSRVLVSSRLYPAELQKVNGEPLPGSSLHFLRGLEDEDALGLWHAFGVSGSDEKLLPVFHSFENYPLLIRALAGEVAGYRRAPGDFDRWQEAHPDFNPFELPPVQVKSHVLTYALQGLDGPARQALHTVAAFRMPATYDTLAALLVGAGKPFADENTLDAVLSDLEDRGLLGWDKRSNRYDLHPVVRGVAWGMADEGVRDLTYEAMADHFAAIPEVDEAAIDSLEDLAPALELIHSLIVLGRYDEAELVFRRYLFRGMTFVLSANHKLMEVLEMFFPDGVDQPPAVSTPFRQANILNQLAAVYTSSGKPAEAIPLFRASIVVARAGKHVRLLKSSLNYYTNVLMLHGDLREAQAAGRRALQFAREIGHSFTETVSLMWLGLVAAAMGAREEAEACFTRGLAFFGPRTVNQASILLHVYRAWAWLWFGDGEAAALAERAIELANRRPYARPLASAHYVGGMAALQQGDFPLANRRLHDALLQSRTTQYVELETAIMAGIARLHLWQQDWPAAAKTLDEVQAILQTAAYRYPSVDALNLRAQLERAQGNTDAAIDAASEAYRQAWCDGPPYAYHWGLAVAKKHLSELGAPYPDMPPFDPSNYEPMPAVKIDPGNGD